MKPWGTMALTLVALLTVLALLSGCDTLENRVDATRDFASRHPAVTAVTSAVVAAGVTYAIEHRGHHRDERSPFRVVAPGTSTTQPVDCATNPYQCQ